MGEQTMLSRKPILVTGTLRSGSTWVGRIIGEAPLVGYIHEPFAENVRPGTRRGEFGHGMPYVTDEHENEPIFYEQIKDTIDYRFDLIGGISRIRHSDRRSKDVQRYLKTFYDFLSYRIINARPLLKDPAAVFSAEWLASKFDMSIVVLIRHPAAFVGSLKRKKGMKISFSDLLSQPLLMRDYLYPFESEIREYATNEYDRLAQASLLWKLVHHVIVEYQKKHKNWIFIRHEDLSRDPINSFQNLFNTLDLEFSEEVRNKIEEYSSSSTLVEPPKGELAFFKRDSKANIWSWKERLTASEIQKIKVEVEEVSSKFYSNQDWEGPLPLEPASKAKLSE